MSNRWNAFQEEDQVEIPKTTSNPLRKIKKKLEKNKYNMIKTQVLNYIMNY